MSIWKASRLHYDLLVARLVPDLGHELTSISKVARAHPGLLAMLRVRRDQSTMGLVDLHKLLNEGLHGLRRWRATALNHTPSPSLDRVVLVIHGKSAVFQPPPPL